MRRLDRVLLSALLPVAVGCSRQSDTDKSTASADTAETGCPAGASCIATNASGQAEAGGTYTAQCTGRFADYVDVVPANDSSVRFRLSQNYPASAQVPSGGFPWDTVSFRTAQGAVQYMNLVRDWIYDGMLAADWRPEHNTTHQWYHMPWMHVGRRAREFLRGMTEERSLTGPELGIDSGVTVQNFAVGFYNDVGATAIRASWQGTQPNAAAAQSPPGTVVAKILFSAARPGDFQGADILAGAPSFSINVLPRGATTKQIMPVRLLQMDVAIRDPRAGPTGWIFGTFAYDTSASGPTPWHRMVPLGVMWGNDPTVPLSGGGTLHETVISRAAPSYALTHLPTSGRLNGPVDNPASACMSCHSTAQAPAAAQMIPPQSCSAVQVRNWYRDLPGSQAFGAVTSACAAGPSQGLVALDYSLQQSVAFANVASGTLFNPCDSSGSAVEMTKRTIARRGGYPVER